MEWRIIAYNIQLETDPRIEDAVDEALAEKSDAETDSAASETSETAPEIVAVED